MKNVYLFPYNDISLSLAKKKDFLDEYKLLGFIDNKKENAIHLKDINNNYDEIIICSSTYHYEIYNQLLESRIEINKIKIYIPKTNTFVKNIDLVSYLSFGTLDDYEFIKNLKNKHLNERIFLVGNGPSLKIEDLDKLKEELTFAANKIFLSYEDTEWRPTYYTVEDDLVYFQNEAQIDRLTDSIKLFPFYTLNWSNRLQFSHYFYFNYYPDRKDFPQFNPDPISKGIFWGSTVIYTMIQWAIYMGCKEIYLIGVDFNFEVPQKYELNEQQRKELICEGEMNHFHKDYRKVGEKWNLPNLDVQLRTFVKAKEYCDKYDVQIYNASRFTKLDVFDKISFDDLV